MYKFVIMIADLAHVHALCLLQIGPWRIYNADVVQLVAFLFLKMLLHSHVVS